MVLLLETAQHDSLLLGSQLLVRLLERCVMLDEVLLVLSELFCCAGFGLA